MTYAIYYEFQGDAGANEVYQALFVPAIKLSAVTIQPTLFQKKVSDAQPNKRWEVVKTPVTNYAPSATTTALDLDQIMAAELKQFEGLSSYMRTPMVGNMTLRSAEPLYLGESSILSLHEDPRDMPVEVRTAITNLREVHNLPELPGR